MPKLHDILPDRPRALFIGINPGLESGRVGHHFAGKSNPFWRLLAAAELTPEPLLAAEEDRLAEWGLGLTNLCQRTTRTAAELTKDELLRGRRRLQKLIPKVAPGVVAFVGLSLYQTYFELQRSGGAGAKPERIGTARVFVLPNPSGLNASFPGFKEKLVWFRELRRFLELPVTPEKGQR